MTDTIFGNPDGQQSAPNSQTPEGAPQGQQSGNPAESDPNVNQYADLLTGITAEDGRQKYATVEDALKSVPHAQKTIQDLNTKVKELEQKVQDSNNIDDVLQRIQSQQAATGNPQVQELDETKLAQMLEQQLTAREQAQLQKANQQIVVDSLEKAYGDKAQEVYINRAKELGMNVSVLNSLAMESPTAALAYFDKTPAPTPSGLGQTDINTAGFQQQETTVDPMDQFRSSESSLVKQWRQSVANTKVT